MAMTKICLMICIFLLLIAYHMITSKSPKRIYSRSRSEMSVKNVITTDADLAKKFWTFHLREHDITCNIPNIDPYHPSILHLLKEPKPIKCADKYPLLFKSTVDSTIVPLKTLEDYGKLGVNDPCCYHDVKRIERQNKPDDAYILSKACSPISLVMKTAVRKKAEFVAIRCSINKNKTLEMFKQFEASLNETIVDMHTFVPVKSNVEKRIMNISNGQGRSKNVDRLNVVILGLDSISHMNFIRVMPKTYAYLMHNLSAVEMNGYNKVGGNTYPNMVAVLTGQVTTDYTISCESNKTFDNCPFIWKQYAQNGYRTSYGEDATPTGIFNLHTTGFRQVPTDYYLRPFGVAAENLIGHHEAVSVNQCYGPRLQFNVLLDYMKKMAYAMGRNKRYFQFLWSTSLTHDFLNDGKVGDQDLLLMLQWFQNEGYFNNTAFVLMSDHGQGSGKILDYQAGILEWKMPFLFFVFPTWFRVKYKHAFENLQTNSARLTTPYDLHETLNDLVNLNGLTSQSISQRQIELASAEKNGSVPRAISLFLPVPRTRTCSMAGVDVNFCICHKTTKMSIGSWNVRMIAQVAVTYMNSLFPRKLLCAILVLDAVTSVQYGYNDNATEEVYHISFSVKPSDASFYASVIKESHGWKVSGTIGRTNLYGNQSYCVDDKTLKLYCYCVDLLW